MKKPKRVPRYSADPSVLWRVISNVTPYDPVAFAAADNRGRVAFEKMRNGAGTTADYDELCATLNTASKRLKVLGVTESIPVSNAAAEAMIRCRERYESWGKFGFDGPGMAAMQEALDLHSEVLAVSTEGEMMKAQIFDLRRGK